MKSRYFMLEELVRKDVFRKYGQAAWGFFDPRLIETIDFLKDHFKWTITINNYPFGGDMEQRGFRDNLCPIVVNSCKKNKLYCSPHMRGMAVDFNVKGMSSEQARSEIIKAKNLLPYPIRLEDDVTWVHLDVVDTGNKVYVFK